MPVIVLGEPEADAVDRVRAFDRGCDDYVMRPFHYDELLARIRAVLRRSDHSSPDGMLQVGEIVIDLPTRCVTVAGQCCRCPQRSMASSHRLATAPTHVFPKQELLRDVWGYRSVARTARSTPTPAVCDGASRSSADAPYSTSGGWAIG